MSLRIKLAKREMQKLSYMGNLTISERDRTSSCESIYSLGLGKTVTVSILHLPSEKIKTTKNNYRILRKVRQVLSDSSNTESVYILGATKKFYRSVY